MSIRINRLLVSVEEELKFSRGQAGERKKRIFFYNKKKFNFLDGRARSRLLRREILEYCSRNRQLHSISGFPIPKKTRVVRTLDHILCILYTF